MNGELISRETETKFLGVIINSKLNWGNHIKLISSKIGKSIGILCKVRHILNEASCLQLYHSLVEPYLHYCCLIWGSNTTNVHLNKLHKLQKKCTRIITFSDYIAPSQPIMDRLGVLNIYDLFKMQLYTSMYRYMHDLLPKCLNVAFELRLNVHNHYTRNCSKLNVPFCRTKFRQATIAYLGPILWYLLDEALQQSSSITLFKRKIKEYLISMHKLIID
jgi:hypothetical protein